jgi:tetratricopeptide (TPR) repeat protein
MNMRALHIGLVTTICALSACAPSGNTAAPSNTIVLVGNQQTGDLYTKDVVPGVAARKKGNLDADIADQNAALALMPSLPAAHFERGQAYIDKSEWDNAIADLTLVIQQDNSPQRPPSMLQGAYQLRGVAYGFKGMEPQAIADSTQAIALNPKDPAPWKDRCLWRSTSGDLTNALADCTQSLLLEPDQSAVLATRGLINLKLKHYDASIADNRAALKLKPKLAMSLYGLGLAQQAKHDPHAKANLAAAKAINPNVAALFEQPQP